MSSRSFWSARTYAQPTLAPLPSGRWRSTPGPSSSISGPASSERVQLLWLPAGLALQAIAVYVAVGAAATVLRLGIRADNDGLPGSLLLDAGTVPADTAGSRTLAVSYTVPSNPASGVPLWLSVTPQGGTVTLVANHVISETRDMTAASTALLYHGCAVQGSVAGALPTTFAATSTAGPAPTFAVQAA